MIGNANNALNDVISTLIFGFIGFLYGQVRLAAAAVNPGIDARQNRRELFVDLDRGLRRQMADVSDGHGIDRSHHLYRRLSDAQGEHGQGQIRASGRRGLVQQDRFIHYLSSCNFSEILMAEHQGL